MTAPAAPAAAAPPTRLLQQLRSLRAASSGRHQEAEHAHAHRGVPLLHQLQQGPSAGVAGVQQAAEVGQAAGAVALQRALCCCSHPSVRVLQGRQAAASSNISQIGVFINQTYGASSAHLGLRYVQVA